MKVDQRALEGIEEKIRRADEHFRLITDEQAAWDTRKPWRLVPEVHDGGLKHLYRLKILDPMPVRWAVILGEAVHNYRSALEQCVYWLTVDWTGRELEGTAFPVYRKRADFNRTSRKDPSGWARDGGMYKIRGVGPGPQAFIEKLQPYPQRRTHYTEAIRHIHDLWNQDKHRLVHLWGIRFGDEKLGLPKELSSHCVLSMDRRVLHDEAIVLRIACSTPYDQVKVTGQIGATVAFFGGRRSMGGRKSLWDIGQTVSDVIRKLAGAIGRQDEQINLDVWTSSVGAAQP